MASSERVFRLLDTPRSIADPPTARELKHVRGEVTFDRVKASKVRVLFTHAGKARSGVSEILIWRE